jgi:hypothetical protein
VEVEKGGVCCDEKEREEKKGTELRKGRIGRGQRTAGGFLFLRFVLRLLPWVKFYMYVLESERGSSRHTPT